MLYTIDNYNQNEVEITNLPKPCCICNNSTHFVDFYTKLNVCSEECLNVLKEKTDSIEEGFNKW